MKLRLLTGALILLALITSQSASAAFCALRDPVETIARLFPEATSHQSVIKVVGEEQRRAVSDLLPPNTLHFSELGQHTLYVVFNENKPLGYLHVRSEESEWGLVEVAWALDTELKVLDFHLQRCRSRAKRWVEAPEFRNQLRGLAYPDMKQLLAADGTSLRPGAITINPAAVPLAEVVIKCGLKTMVVTELAWADEVAHYGQLARAQASFEQATDLSFVEPDILKSRHESVARSFPGNTTAMGFLGSELMTVSSSTGQKLGAVFRHPLMEENPGAPLEWHFAPTGEVVAVYSPADWPDRETAEALSAHVSHIFDEETTCADRPQLMTKQAAMMARLAFE